MEIEKFLLDPLPYPLKNHIPDIEDSHFIFLIIDKMSVSHFLKNSS